MTSNFPEVNSKRMYFCANYLFVTAVPKGVSPHIIVLSRQTVSIKAIQVMLEQVKMSIGRKGRLERLEEKEIVTISSCV